MEAVRQNPPRILLTIAYDGTDYAGWQIQPNDHGATIQGLIEDRLSQLYANQAIRIHASGRTDNGVHALGQAAHFEPPERPLIPVGQLPRILNGKLPPAIRIRESQPVAADFHARFSNLGKTYCYLIRRGMPSPFAGRYSWRLTDCQNLEAMRESAKHLVGEHDFSAFTVSRNDVDNPVRNIHRIEIKEFGDIVAIGFTGNGFLYKMVRSLVGTISEVGRNRMHPAKVAEILNSQKRSNAGKTAPPYGLFLLKVFFSEKEMREFRITEIPFCHKE